MTLMPNKIAQGIACCLDDHCDICSMRSKEWSDRGMAGCAAFWEGTAVIPKALAENAAAALVALNKLANRRAAQAGEAYWIPENTRAGSYIWICSECRARAYDIPHGVRRERIKTCSLNYCPHCGLPMTAKQPPTGEYADRDTAYPASQDLLLPAT